MGHTKKGEQYFFGMKAHIGVDAQSGIVHTVIGTAANVHDVTQAFALLTGNETHVLGDAGYRGVESRQEAKNLSVQWVISMMRSKRSGLDLSTKWGRIRENVEYLKSSIRAKVEHPFRILKCQFGHTKVRYNGLKKNTQ
jgi:IS5 family transposase